MASILASALELDACGDGMYQRDTDRTFWGHDAHFGGYAQALMLAAMGRELGDDAKAPAMVATHFMRPFVAGPIRIETTVERVGRTLATVSARAESGGKPAGVALATFSIPRSTQGFVDCAMPDVDPLRPDEPAGSVEFGIATHDHFAFYPRFGDLAFAPGDAEAGGWVKPRFEGPVDAALLTMLVDLWVPAAYRRFDEPVVAVSSDITIHFRTPLPAAVPPDSPLLIHLRTKQVTNGFADEDATVWSCDGRLLAQGRQVRFLTDIPSPRLSTLDHK